MEVAGSEVWLRAGDDVSEGAGMATAGEAGDERREIRKDVDDLG